ncbi:MAG: hypothetical protein U0746_14520 [Gemmataceae bacterium]
MNRILTTLAVGALVGCTALAADPIKSGPQVGDSVSPFHPSHVTGEYAGKNTCLV